MVWLGRLSTASCLFCLQSPTRRPPPPLLLLVKTPLMTLSRDQAPPVCHPLQPFSFRKLSVSGSASTHSAAFAITPKLAGAVSQLSNGPTAETLITGSVSAAS